jgi:protein-disulfide isomerase
MVQPVADLLMRWRQLLALLTVLLLGGTAPVLAASSSSEIPDVVATVQGQPIAAEELIEAAKSDLIRLETQRYELLKNKLDELVARHIVGLEAAKRGISVQEFEQSEIVAKTPPVTPEAVKEYYEANKDRIRQPFEQIEVRLTTYLQQRAQQQRQQELFQELMQRYPVTIALRPPKVEVTADDDPATGPADTLVTIIEFSDFQCPYCRRVQPALKRLLEEYQGKVRLVFRDFPLRQAHPQAQKAAEAAQCAADQQQFWPYHDKLFTVSDLQLEQLKKYAQDLGLKSEEFNTCLDSGKHANEVEKDLQDGQDAGVSATPTFFINGVPLSGAVPYERFKEMVDVALQEVQSAKKTN